MIRNTTFIYRENCDIINLSEQNNDIKEYLTKIRVNNHKKNKFEIIRNKYEVDDIDNIITPNTSWFLLSKSKIDSKMNRYKINPGEIIKIGRITMRIRDIIFVDNKENNLLNESKGTNYNQKEMQTLKTEGVPFNEQNNIKKSEKILIKKKHKKNQKEIFSKLEKKNKVCRICYMEEESENPLVQPCTCSGSMKFIHLSCLKQWISTRSCIKIDNSKDCSIFLIKPVDCELCKTKFPDFIKYEGILYPLLDFKNEFENYLTLESMTLDKQNNKFIYVINLEKNRKIKVGRGHESMVILSDISVSRVHCYMVVENKNVFLEDNGSKFGTLILVQTPSIKLVDDLPLYLQIGRTFFEFKIKKKTKLFSCCEAEEKASIYYYYNQNEKYIKDNLGMVVKQDISDVDDEEDNLINNSLEQKYPLDIAKKYKVNNSIKINDGDKMSDNEYLLLKHNKLNKNIKKTMIYNENIKNNDESYKELNKKEENSKEVQEEEEIEEEEEEIEVESSNNGDNATASINNLEENENESSEIQKDENNSEVNE